VKFLKIVLLLFAALFAAVFVAADNITMRSELWTHSKDVLDAMRDDLFAVSDDVTDRVTDRITALLELQAVDIEKAVRASSPPLCGKKRRVMPLWGKVLVWSVTFMLICLYLVFVVWLAYNSALHHRAMAGVAAT
jgi:hypothetical protein